MISMQDEVSKWIMQLFRKLTQNQRVITWNPTAFPWYANTSTLIVKEVQRCCYSLMAASQVYYIMLHSLNRDISNEMGRNTRCIKIHISTELYIILMMQW